MQIQQIAHHWLQQQHIFPTQLIPLSGYTNYVFLVETQEKPKHSILRLGNTTLASNLSPLAHNPSITIAKHQAAAELGLAPELLGYDHKNRLMWLAYVGQAKGIQLVDMPEIHALLDRLHSSHIDWRSTEPPDPIGLEALRHLMQSSSNPRIHMRSEQLLALADRYDFGEHKATPVHGDLNPDNCLHDGKRWWLIDWDYAGQRNAAWDYASLIVEHNWHLRQATALAPHLSRHFLAWSCSYFALMSWAWHLQRGSDCNVIKQKQKQCDAWFEWCL